MNSILFDMFKWVALQWWRWPAVSVLWAMFHIV